MDNSSEKYWVWFVYSALAIITFAVFWQVHHFEFIIYDDPAYVSENNNISSGLTGKGIVWVFTHEHGGNWHPLTGLSHMLDCQLFGLNPGKHHLVNLLFHIANALLLFTVLRKMTRAFWQSAFVAALFALHPLHVESVAWISERKDVLSTLFWILTMTAYFRYVKNPAPSRYLLTFLLFALGLMAKPMLVTLPFTLLLLDYWPLNRLNVNNRKHFYHLVVEKVPFFVLAAVSSVITFLVQQSSGAIANIQRLPLEARLVISITSYLKYIQKMFWPNRLAIVYPLVGNIPPPSLVLVAILIILIISVLAILLSAKYKYLPVGWLWYLGTLVPVIGLVQAGAQDLADRYTYIPMIGLFIIVAWGINDLLLHYPFRKILLIAAGSSTVLALSICTVSQLRYWENSLSLFEHAIAVTNKNNIAHMNFGLALMGKNKFNEAAYQFRQALQIWPGDIEATKSLGTALIKLNRYQEAADVYKQAIKIKTDAEIYNNLGVACTRLGHFEEAAENYKQAIRIKPNYVEAYNNIGTVYNQLGQHQDAVEVYKQAIRLKPDYVNAHYNLGLTYLSAGDKDSAMKEYEILKKLDAEKANGLLNSIQK